MYNSWCLFTILSLLEMLHFDQNQKDYLYPYSKRFFVEHCLDQYTFGTSSGFIYQRPGDGIIQNFEVLGIQSPSSAQLGINFFYFLTKEQLNALFVDYRDEANKRKLVKNTTVSFYEQFIFYINVRIVYYATML